MRPICARALVLGFWLNAVALGSALGCRAETSDSALREELRQAVVRGRQACPLNPRFIGRNELGKLEVERVRITPEQGQDAVVVLYRPKGSDGRLPGVIIQHFLGATKDHPALVTLANGLAQKGFVVAAIDGRHRGDRQNGRTLEAAILDALRTGKERPLFLDTAYDVLRLVDYLQMRPDVDPERIGMTGFSEGGVISWICAAADERIRAVVPLIGVTSFRDAVNAGGALTAAAGLKIIDPVIKDYARDRGQSDVTPGLVREAWMKLLPELTDRLDAPEVLHLIAPRPLLILNHEKDELFPLEGARRAFERAKLRYQAVQAGDRIAMQVAPGLGHNGFSLAEVGQMMAWMERWLKGGATN